MAAETSKQREAFTVYWELGQERTIARLREALAARGRRVGLRTLYEWSRRHAWQARLAALEREARAAEDAARIAALRAMYERQAHAALLLQQRGAAVLVGLPDGALSPETAIRALIEGARLERIARGEPAERWAHTGPVEDSDDRYAHFSDDELRRLLTHIEADPAGAGAPPAAGPRLLGDDGADAAGEAAAADAGDGGDLP